MHYIILFFTGIVVGIMNAIAGGGMLVGFPVLLATGMPPLVANVTSSIIVLPGQLSSAFGYRSYLRKVPKRYLWLLLPCITGATAGALILRRTSSSDFEKIIPWLIAFAVVLFIFQPLIQIQLRKRWHHKTKSKNVPGWLFVCLFPLSIYGGYFGAGVGFIFLALFSFTSLGDTHMLNALKNAYFTVSCLVSLLVLYSTGLIDWRVGAVMGSGNLIGGYCGSVYAQKVNGKSLRVIVIIIGVVTAAFLFIHTYA